MLDREGQEVTILDLDPDAFRRLPVGFGGQRHVGNGIDQEVLSRIGVGEADAFVVVTQGDNRNVMAASSLNVPGGPRKARRRLISSCLSAL